MSTPIPSEIRERVAADIRRELAYRDIAQKTLIPIFRAQQQNVSARLKGKISIRVEDLVLIADHIGCEPADLLAGALDREAASA